MEREKGERQWREEGAERGMRGERRVEGGRAEIRRQRRDKVRGEREERELEGRERKG